MGTPASSLDQLDPETLLALAPVVAAAVAQGAFSPEWLNSVIRLEWLIAVDPAKWAQAAQGLGSSTRSQWHTGRTEIPHEPIGNRRRSLHKLYETLENLIPDQQVTLPWLVGLDRPSRTLTSRAERVRWTASVLYPTATGKTEPERVLWSEAPPYHRPEVTDPLPEAWFTETVMDDLASNIPITMDPAWLRTGVVTVPTFATPHPTLTIGEIAPDVEVKLNRMDIVALFARRNGTQPMPPALAACDPYQKLSEAHDQANRSQAAPPARPAETSFLLSWRNAFAVCAKDGHGPAPVSAKSYPEGVRVLVSEDIRDGAVIGSSDGNRCFIVLNKNAGA